jgi:hypothetical protein
MEKPGGLRDEKRLRTCFRHGMVTWLPHYGHAYGLWTHTDSYILLQHVAKLVLKQGSLRHLEQLYMTRLGPYCGYLIC